MGCAGVESGLSGLRLVFNAIWLTIFGVGCLVTGLVVMVVLDRTIRWKGFRYE